MTEIPSPLIDVMPCKHGTGVFALKCVTKGTILATWDKITIIGRERPYHKDLRIGETEWWAEEPSISPLSWTNFIDHSSDPNCVFIIDRANLTASLRTTKDLFVGDELFIKYDDYFKDNPTFGD